MEGAAVIHQQTQMKGGGIMPWCPKCGTEYREGFTECVECHIPLTDKKPGQKTDTFYAMKKAVTVCTAENRLEAEAIKALLHENDIAVIGRPAAFGQIQAYSGEDTRFGIELLVDESQAGQAKELIDERKHMSDIPFDVNELARLAEEQSLEARPDEPEDNASFKLLPLILGVIALLLILLFLVNGRIDLRLSAWFSFWV